MPAGQTTHKGSCFCGRVRYEIKGPIGPMSNCHCTDCRKSHGAAFATYIDVAKGALTFLVPFCVSNIGVLVATRREP